MLDIVKIENIWKNQHPKSKIIFEEAQRITPGGASHTRIIDKWHTERGVYPFYVTKAQGTKLWDVDGNIYTDYFSNGATFLGHANPDIIRAIKEQATLGPFAHSFSEINLKLVKKIIKMIPCAEVVDFVNSGTEATMGVLRFARAYTKRKKIVKFAGHYHGWCDQLTSNHAGIPEDVFRNTVVIREDDIESLEKTIKRESPAGVIFHFTHGSGGGGMAMGGDKPREFLKAMREITSENDVLLIADEVVSGFRHTPGGAQKYFNVDVDLTTLGKIVTGGTGGSGAIVGKKEIMEVGNPHARPSGECISTEGTFSGNPMSSAAGYAALDVIESAQGKLNEYANKLGERLRDGLNKVFLGYDFPAQAVGCCSVSSVAFTNKLPIKNVTDFLECAEREKLYKWHIYLATHSGIYTYPGVGAIFISAVHTKMDIDHIISSTEDFVQNVK